MGGTDDEDNLEYVTVEEHAERHRVLWETHGKQADFMAWQMLSGKTNESEAMRREVAKEGFQSFLKDPVRSESWRLNISTTLTGRSQSEETRTKRSESLKRFHSDSERHEEYLSKVQNIYRPPPTDSHKKKMDEGRRKSKTWRDAVTSDEYRLKKSRSDPRSRALVIDGVLYHSLRHAARESGLKGSYIDAVRRGAKTDDRITFLELGDGLPDHLLSQELVTVRDGQD